MNYPSSHPEPLAADRTNMSVSKGKTIFSSHILQNVVIIIVMIKYLSHKFYSVCDIGGLLIKGNKLKI